MQLTDTMRRYIVHWGEMGSRWGINRSVRRVTGRTYEELYASWEQSLKKRYGAQAAQIRTRGLREGRRLTRRGHSARQGSPCSASP